MKSELARLAELLADFDRLLNGDAVIVTREEKAAAIGMTKALLATAKDLWTAEDMRQGELSR